MRKNPHGRISKREPKEQYLSIRVSIGLVYQVRVMSCRSKGIIQLNGSILTRPI